MATYSSILAWRIPEMGEPGAGMAVAGWGDAGAESIRLAEVTQAPQPLFKGHLLGATSFSPAASCCQTWARLRCSYSPG